MDLSKRIVYIYIGTSAILVVTSLLTIIDRNSVATTTMLKQSHMLPALSNKDVRNTLIVNYVCVCMCVNLVLFLGLG